MKTPLTRDGVPNCRVGTVPGLIDNEGITTWEFGVVHSEEDRQAAVRRARHRARDRIFGLIFIGVVALGVVSLYYSLNWITGLIILGLVLLVAGIGWITGTLHTRGPDD
jgi:hypothetical protein